MGGILAAVIAIPILCMALFTVGAFLKGFLGW